MRAVFMCIIFAGLLWGHAFGQSIYPALPNADYAIYTTIVDDFSKCSDETYGFLRSKLLFIKPVTKEKDKHSFRLNFAIAQENLAFLIRPKTTFYEEPGWKTFIASVDTNQFISYEIKHSLTLECRQSEMWSSQLEDYYFGKENHLNRGFDALRKDYTNFGGIICFSKVAYSDDRQKALCYYSKISDGKAGAGYVVFLERKDGAWKLVGSAELWVA